MKTKAAMATAAMAAGSTKAAEAALLAALLGLALAAVPTHAQPVAANPRPAADSAALDLNALMALLAQRREGQATFTELRQVAGLDAPLQASGTLQFAAPDKLARRTLAPRPESFLVDGPKLTLERAGRTRSLMIDSVPELAAMVSGLRGTLAGDMGALQQHFATQVEGRPAQWKLTLKPRDARVAGVVQLVRIEGRQGDVRQVETVLADGDRSTMTITPLAPGQSLPAAQAPNMVTPPVVIRAP